MYRIEIYQPDDYPAIEIKVLLEENFFWPWTSYISAKKVGISVSGVNVSAEKKVAQSTVKFSVHFEECSPNQAEQHAEWIELAVSAANRLDALIHTIEDFDRPISARIVDKAITVYFDDDK